MSYELDPPFKASDVVSISMKEEMELLKRQNYELLTLLEEYGIQHKDVKKTSDVEWICRSEIAKIKMLSENSALSGDDVDNLEKLTKVLERELNKASNFGRKTPRGKKLETSDLIEIAKNNEEETNK